MKAQEQSETQSVWTHAYRELNPMVAVRTELTGLLDHLKKFNQAKPVAEDNWVGGKEGQTRYIVRSVRKLLALEEVQNLVLTVETRSTLINCLGAVRQYGAFDDHYDEKALEELQYRLDQS